MKPSRPPPPAASESQTRGIVARLKDHKVLQWAIAYLGAALAIAQAYELVANAFGWPNGVTRAVVLTLIVGFPIALTVAWYHGHRALRRISVGEVAIVSVLLLIGASAFTFALRRDDVAAASSVAAPSASVSTPPSAAPARTDAPAGTRLAALPNKVAVLPCENQSPDPADAYFASGLHQDIIWQLDKLRNLTPIPRLTVLRYADTSLSVAAIATELSVRALLDCTIRYADNRVRITAELVDSTGLQTLWQGNYEPSLADIKDVFAVQADIAMNIANALSVFFTPGEQALLEKPPTVSTEAYVLFLKAYEEPDYALTVDLFEQAVAADADFAAPKAALAFLWASELINTNYSAAIAPEARADHVAKVRAYAQRALELDPVTPFARSALTITAMLNWRWTDAYERIARARDVAPNDVTQYDIYLLSYLGRYDEARNVVERGEQLYPNDPNNFIWRGWRSGSRTRRYDEAAPAPLLLTRRGRYGPAIRAADA
jgi:TolB-like protein